MASLFRKQLFSSLTLRSSFRHAPKPPICTFTPHKRFVANTVSAKPASDDFAHALLNLKEELGNSANDLAKIIAGASPQKGHSIIGDRLLTSGFVDLTRSVAQQVPKAALQLGLMGGIPYVASAGATVFLAHQSSLASAGVPTAYDTTTTLAMLQQALQIEVTYGAVMLSFLGAMHWGMEFAGYGGQKGIQRLTLGVAPVLYAWSTLMLDPALALIAQWFGFTVLWWADCKATTFGWAPPWYSQYRFYLSLVVGACIIGTLAGSSYFGPVPGRSRAAYELEAIRKERQKYKPLREVGVIHVGDMEVIPAPLNSEVFTIIRKHRENT